MSHIFIQTYYSYMPYKIKIHFILILEKSYRIIILQGIVQCILRNGRYLLGQFCRVKIGLFVDDVNPTYFSLMFLGSIIRNLCQVMLKCNSVASFWPHLVLLTFKPHVFKIKWLISDTKVLYLTLILRKNLEDLIPYQ